MIIVLLTLLAIALALTGIGAMLSSPAKISHQRRVSSVHREERHTPLKRRASQQLRDERQLLHRPHPFEHRESAKMAAVVDRGNTFFSLGGKRTPWLGITLILVSLFVFGAYSLQLLLPHSALLLAAAWSNTASSAPTLNTSGASSPAKITWPEVSGASKALVRLGQLDTAQYASSQEYTTWAYSACSVAAMTEIFNAYGHHYRITDILNVEAKLGEITPALGLVEPTGIDRTAAQFGFKAIWLHTLTQRPYHVCESWHSGHYQLSPRPMVWRAHSCRPRWK